MISIHRTNDVTDNFSSPLREAWQSSRTLLSELAERLNLPTDIASQALFLIPQTVDNPRDAMSEFATTMSAEEEVTYITSPSIDGKTSGLVVVPAKDSTPNNFYLTPFIDTHSRLIAWWLTTFWRSLDLAKSTWELAEANRFISASACSRSLLETSAAFWCEVIEIADLWRKIKLRGITKVSAINDWRELNNWVWQQPMAASSIPAHQIWKSSGQTYRRLMYSRT
jgi:hypothetical protein